MRICGYGGARHAACAGHEARQGLGTENGVAWLKRSARPIKGCGMEGFIASWYARQTARDSEEFQRTARRIAAHLNSGSPRARNRAGAGLSRHRTWPSSPAAGSPGSISAARSCASPRENARKAGVRVDFEHGDAADLPFPDNQFDFIVCRAAFKNFARPLVALNEMHRVLKAGGTALIIDLRKDFSRRAINDYVRGRGVFNAADHQADFQHHAQEAGLYSRRPWRNWCRSRRSAKAKSAWTRSGSKQWLHK